MKIRTDFVTNSSSSSFVSMEITSPLLAKVLEDYKTALAARGELPEDEGYEDYLLLPFKVVEGCRIVADDEDLGAFGYVPASLDETVDSFFDSIECLNSQIWPEERRPNVVPLLRTLRTLREDVVDNIESVDWDYYDTGWGGDHLLRFEPDWFPKECADAVWSEIAEEKGVPVEELTQDDWNEHVSGETSVEKVSFTYDRASGKSEYTRTVGLNDF